MVSLVCLEKHMPWGKVFFSSCFFLFREAHALEKGLSLGLCREYVYVYFTLQSVETDPCWSVWFVREADALGKGLCSGLDLLWKSFESYCRLLFLQI